MGLYKGDNQLEIGNRKKKKTKKKKKGKKTYKISRRLYKSDGRDPQNRWRRRQ